MVPLGEKVPPRNQDYKNLNQGDRKHKFFKWVIDGHSEWFPSSAPWFPDLCILCECNGLLV